jgi:hypothetical protein
MDKKNTRREFLKQSAVVGVGAGAFGRVGSAEAQQIVWDREVDVAVIGAGAAGLPAAIAEPRTSVVEPGCRRRRGSRIHQMPSSKTGASTITR